MTGRCVHTLVTQRTQRKDQPTLSRFALSIAASSAASACRCCTDSSCDVNAATVDSAAARDVKSSAQTQPNSTTGKSQGIVLGQLNSWSQQ